MGAVHVHVHGLENSYLYQRVNPGTIQQTGDIDGDGTSVECKQVGVLHQRATACKQFLTGIFRRILLPALKELLELWGALFLTLAIVGVIIIEHAREELTLGQTLVGGALLLVVIELATILAKQEEQVYLTIIIGQ